MFDTDKEFEPVWRNAPWYAKLFGKEIAKRWFSDGAMKHYLRTSQQSSIKEEK